MTKGFLPSPPVSGFLSEHTTIESAVTKPSIAQLMSLKTATGRELEIIKSIAPWWKQLGYLMDCDDEGRTVAFIEVEHHSKLACCQEMFLLWLKSPYATWENLIGLLIDCEHEYLAGRIEDALGLWMAIFSG